MVLAAPALCLFLGLVAVPVVAVVLTSFTAWTGFNIRDIRWAGLSNYAELAQDGIFWRALAHTVAFTLATTLLLNAVGLALALLVDTRVRGTGLLKALLFLPVLLSPGHRGADVVRVCCGAWGAASISSSTSSA
jgi:raffinose/stachyose/melibiose transport system permease protein